MREFIADAPYFAQGWRAELLLGLGEVDAAVGIYRSLAPQLDHLPGQVHEWLVVLVSMSALAISAGDRPGVEKLRAALEPYAQLHVSGPVTTPYGGPVALPLARVASYLGDQEAARRHARDALARAEAMGAPWFAASARGLLADVTPSLPPLSPRETEVARLVGQGRTNREIAATLYLSERTVEQHVRSILHKLDLPNRSAIAAWVVRAG